MPKFLETKLRTTAQRLGKSGAAANRYVYGALNNMGAMKGSQETAKGRAMDAKHAADTGAAPPHAAPVKRARKLPAKMVARGKAIAAAHAHLAKTVPGFRKLPSRERFRAAHAHLAKGGAY